MKKINLYLFEYALNYILRHKAKNFFTLFVLSFMTALLASVFFMATSLKYELNLSVDALSDIIVQNTKAGMHTTIDGSVLDDILNMDGVKDAQSRVWGYYYFSKADSNIVIIGVDTFEQQYTKLLQNITQNFEFNNHNMVVSNTLKKLFEKNYYKDYFNFIKADGSVKKMDIEAVFNQNISLEGVDTVVMSKTAASDILGIDEKKASDIIVDVYNPKEIAMIASKIQIKYPNFQVKTAQDIKVGYENIFNYEGGLFLALFVVTIFTFFIIIYDRLSGLSSQEKKEIGILKALGWKIEDVLRAKFYEGVILSFSAYIIGIVAALFFVYILNAPLLKNLFLSNSTLSEAFYFPFVFDYKTLFLLFLLSVPIYIAATIIPSWRISTLDADEVIR